MLHLSWARTQETAIEEVEDKQEPRNRSVLHHLDRCCRRWLQQQRSKYLRCVLQGTSLGQQSSDDRWMDPIDI